MRTMVLEDLPIFARIKSPSFAGKKIPYMEHVDMVDDTYKL